MTELKAIKGGLGHDDKDEAIRKYRLTRDRIKPRLRVVQPMSIVVPYPTTRDIEEKDLAR